MLLENVSERKRRINSAAELKVALAIRGLWMLFVSFANTAGGMTLLR
ncbi:hypothetical protein IWX64_000090 [Arthrobacter sp. CAN_A212]